MFEKYWGHNLEVHQILIDFKKACDSSERDIWEVHKGQYTKMGRTCDTRWGQLPE